MNRLFSALLIFSLFFLLFAGFFHPITAITQDLGRHLITGEIITKTFSVPQTNLYSYTYPDFPFINHHWFSEVLFYGIYQLSGFPGLLLFTTVVMLLAFTFIFFYTLRQKIKTRHSGDECNEDSRINGERFWTSQNDNIFPLTIISIFYIRILFERTDVRPEIFSFFFLSVFIVILYKNRERFTKLIFLLPILELFWVNTHIYFPIGIAVIGLFLIEAIISYTKNPKHEIRNEKQIQMTKMPNTKRFDHLNIRILKLVSPARNAVATAGRSFDIRISNLLLILFLTAFFTLLNPNGLSGALYPFQVFQNYGYQIEENQNLFFLWNYFGGKTTIFYFFIVAFSLFSLLTFTIKKTRIIDWLLSIFFTIFAIVAERNLPLFVFGTFIPFANTLSHINFLKLESFKKFNLLKKGALLLLIIFIFWQTKDVIQQRGFGFGVETGAKNAADFFLDNNLKGPIFNNFDIGSYLDYRFYGKEKVFIDGRPEAYPKSFFLQEYIPMQEKREIFDGIAQKYNINTILFAHTDQTPWAETFLKIILSHSEWKSIYLDDTIIILVKNTRENQKLIKQFGMETETINVKTIQKDNFQSLLRLASFFNRTGLLQQEKEMYQKILAVNPTHCPVLKNLSIRLAQENNPATSIYQTKWQQICQ